MRKRDRIIAGLALLVGIVAAICFRFLTGPAAGYVGALFIIGNATAASIFAQERTLRAVFGFFILVGVLLGLVTLVSQVL